MRKINTGKCITPHSLWWNYNLLFSFGSPETNLVTLFFPPFGNVTLVLHINKQINDVGSQDRKGGCILIQNKLAQNMKFHTIVGESAGISRTTCGGRFDASGWTEPLCWVLSSGFISWWADVSSSPTRPPSTVAETFLMSSSSSTLITIK